MKSVYSIEVSFDILKNYEKALERPAVDESKKALERSHKKFMVMTFLHGFDWILGSK